MQERSMHGWDYVTSAAFSGKETLSGKVGGNFRITEQAGISPSSF
jgi:hypothetical protein